MKGFLYKTALVLGIYASLSFAPIGRHADGKGLLVVKKHPGVSLDTVMDVHPTINWVFDDFPYRFVEEKVVPRKSSPVIDGEVYAVLLNGRDNQQAEGYDRFRSNIKNMHEGLMTLGVRQEDIYVVQEKSAGNYMNRIDPTLNNLETVLSNINSKITDDDILIFYMTNHSVPAYQTYRKGEQVVYVGDTQLPASHFLDMLGRSSAGAVWFIDAACNAYETTSNATGNIIGHSFCSPNKRVVGGGTEALADIITKAGCGMIDDNDDTRVSIAEIAKYTAFDYEGASPEGIYVGENRRREVHYMTWQDVDPSKVFLK